MKITQLIMAVLLMMVAQTVQKTGHFMKQSMKSKVKHHVKKRTINMSKAGLHTPMRMSSSKKKEVEVTTNIIKKSADFLDKQKIQAEKAEAAWKTNQKGRLEINNPDDMLVMSGQVYARVIQKGIEDDNMSVFTKLQYKLNEDMLYLMSAPDDYRMVQYGFNLLEVPMKSDKMELAQCCARIEPAIVHVEIELYNYKGYCFRIDLAHQNWLFCDDTVPPLMELQKTLINTIIKAWYRANLPGKSVPQGISESQCSSLPFSWIPAKQSEWPCKCAKLTSRNQSPIGMGSEYPQVENVDDISIQMNFIQSYSITYGLVIQEPEFYADFGQFQFVTPDNATTYNAQKVVFKIGKGEHNIADLIDENVVGELHIHGVSTSGKVGVVAIQIITGTENKFVKTINPKKWDFQKSLTSGGDGDSKICLKGINDPDSTSFVLMDFFNGKVATDRSFFKYTGSLTKPPCSEHVEWYVMSNTAEISSAQLEELKQYGLNAAQIAPNNIRNLQPLNDRKFQYSQVAKCPPMPPKVVEPPNLDYKYIKMSHTVKIPAMATDSVDIKGIFNDHSDKGDVNKITLSDNLNLEYLPTGEKGETPDAITPETMKILIGKFLKGQGMDPKTVEEVTKGLNKGTSKLVQSKNNEQEEVKKKTE